MIFLWGVFAVATIGLLLSRRRTVARHVTTLLYTLIIVCAVCAMVVLDAPFVDTAMLAQVRALCTPPSATTSPVSSEASSATPQTLVAEGSFAVVSVVDGDTLKVRRDDGVTTVRVIGINTPESVDPRRPVECFGAEASAQASALLTGATVTLERDPTQADRDKYNRLLRHVVLPDGRQFGEVMIAQGYAHEYTYDAPYAYQQSYRDAERAAQAAHNGLWAPEACATDGERHDMRDESDS